MASVSGPTARGTSLSCMPIKKSKACTKIMVTATATKYSSERTINKDKPTSAKAKLREYAYIAFTGSVFLDCKSACSENPLLITALSAVTEVHNQNIVLMVLSIRYFYGLYNRFFINLLITCPALQ